MAKPCPKCERPNGDRAERCIYCGSIFPISSVPPPPPSPSGAEAPAAVGPKPERKPLESYQVVVSPGQTLDEESLARLAEELGLDLFSARQKLIHPSPWTARAFPEPKEAQSMVSRLGALGLDAYVVKQSGLDKVMSALQVYRLKGLSEAGVVLLTEGGREVAIAFGDVVLMVRGRIQERSEREEDMEEDVPRVTIGKMLYQDQNDTEEKGMVRELAERFSVRVRPSRINWVLRPGAGSEAMDLYHKGSHQPVRVVESEFDYAGLGPDMQPSSLQNFNTIFRALQSHAPDCPVDNNFNLVGYTFNEAPAPDKTRTELQAALGTSDSSQKLFNNRVAFSEYSARIYLHLLHRKSQPGQPGLTARPAVKHLVLAKAPQELGTWLFLLCLVLIFLKPLAALVAIIMEFAGQVPYFKLFPSLLAFTAADAALNLAVTAFGFYAGIKLLYYKPDAVRATQSFLGLFLLYHLWSTALPILTDLNAPEKIAALYKAGLEPPLTVVIGGWDFIRLLCIMGITGTCYYFLATSTKVRQLFPPPKK